MRLKIELTNFANTFTPKFLFTTITILFVELSAQSISAEYQQPSDINGNLQHASAFLIPSVSSQLKKPITLSIYYETLCPDSLNLLEHQLLPLLKPQNENDTEGSNEAGGQEIETFVDIRLIPYGKAVTMETKGKQGESEYSFLCQHGPLECEGNKLHSCALNAVAKTPKFSTTINAYKMTRFLICTMGFVMSPTRANFTTLSRMSLKSANITTFSSAALDSCFELLPTSGYEEAQTSNLKSEIETCISSKGEGPVLLKQNGDLTNFLNPKLYFVPWVTFNGEWKKSIMEQSQTDLKGVICRLLLSHETQSFKNIIKCQNYGENPRQASSENIVPVPSRNGPIQMQPHFKSMFDTYVPPDGKGVIRGSRGAKSHVPHRFIPKHAIEPIIMKKKLFSKGRDRRGFLHSIPETEMGGAGWRWRTSVHSNMGGGDWRWRRPIAGPINNH